MAETAPSVPGFFDGLGDRLVVTDRSARALEVLRLRPELVTDPRFEPAVRARAGLLAQFQHAGCTHVRHVGRLPGGDGRLALVSDFVTGWRLSEVLQAAEQLDLTLHTNAALFLLRQLVSVVSALHATGPGVSHGALGPERIVVTPTGRLVVTEHVLGSALPFVPSISPQRAWRDLRLVMPADEKEPFAQRGDILQVGLCALALVLSRPLRLDDYPQRLRDLLDRASESKLTGERRPLRPALRTWLEHMLGLVPAAPATAHDAQEGLDRLVSREGYLATPTGLVGLLESVEAYFAGDLVPSVAVPEAPSESAPADVDRDRPGEEAHATPAAPAASQAPEPAAVAVHAEPEIAHVRLVLDEPRGVAPAVPVEEVAVVPSERAAERGKPSAAPARHAEGLDLVPGPRPAWPTPSEAVDSSDNFAPEPGISFTPDDPAEDDWREPPALGPDRAATAAGAAAAREPAPSGHHEPAWLRPAPPSGPQETTRVRPRQSSGAFEVAPVPPVPRPSGSVTSPAEPLVEPIASSVQEDRPVSPVKTGRDPSRGVPTARSASLFGTSHGDEEEMGAEGKPSKVRWLAAAAIACVALAGTLGGWALLGTSASEPSDRTPAAVPSDPRPATVQGDPGDRPAERAAASSESVPVPAVTPSPAASEPAVEPPPSIGELRVIAPFPVDVFEGGVKVGSSGAPIELTAGRHRLDLVNEELQFRSPETVIVRAAARVRVQPAIPTGTVNLNAIPWAEVWIDGERSGETPIGNLSLPIGPHQVVFKHPQLGEQARTLIVIAGAPARLSVEMKQ